MSPVGRNGRKPVRGYDDPTHIDKRITRKGRNAGYGNGAARWWAVGIRSATHGRDNWGDTTPMRATRTCDRYGALDV